MVDRRSEQFYQSEPTANNLKSTGTTVLYAYDKSNFDKAGPISKPLMNIVKKTC